MSLSATREGIATAINTAITANGYSAEIIEWPNQRIASQPVDSRWWRVVIQTGTTNPITIGGVGQRRTRTPFVVIIQIFLPENGGTKEAYEIADKLGKGTSGLDYQRTAPITDATLTPNQIVYLNWETVGITFVGSTNGSSQFNISISGRSDAQDVP